MGTARIVLAVVLLFCTTLAWAAMPVEVIGQPKDLVGSQLVYAVKERIRASSSLQLVYDQSKFRLQVRLLTISDDEHDTSTVYSLVMTWDPGNGSMPLYLTHEVGTCGTNRVDECARLLVADISEESDKLIKFFLKHKGE